ncbi:EF hand family protein [Histomonas meleagridis]|uniref:EF hand family protein n=1 Tax=Histomonas meleagridis TaxID=135588 RepID=UPI00355A503A|nr:EF hand family protein [Histomonas meleagridis]KAH0796398.1 EF hand family protein [Histomonas meleagridis]
MTYDRSKDQTISTVSLHRWIASIGINLTNRSIQLLMVTFKKGNGVDVRGLIDGIANSSESNIQTRQADCSKDLKEIVQELARRRQNLRDILGPYDRRNVGKVTIFNFYRCLGESPSTRSIVNCYSDGTDVNYFKLERDLQEASKHIDTVKLSIPEPTDAFVSLATFIKTHEIDPHIVFSEVDRLNTGRMSKRQFYSTISSMGARIPPSGYKEIAQSFEENGMCNYKLFIQAVEQFQPPPPRTVRARGEVPQELREAESPETLLRNIREIIHSRRIDARSYFVINDNEDEITFNQFSRGITSMKLDLQPEEIEIISNQFKGKYGNIRINDFINSVNPPRKMEEVNVDEVLERLRKYLYETKQQLSPSIRRFDREGSGTVSVQQLISSLKFINFEITSQEIAALRDAFSSNVRGNINWKLLCNKCDPNIEQIKPNTKNQFEESEKLYKQKLYTQPPDNILQILYKLYDVIDAKSIDVYSEIRIHDKYRRGTINQQNFLNFIFSLQIQIPSNELRSLVSYYRDSGNPEINYEHFIYDLSRVTEIRKNQKEKEIEQRKIKSTEIKTPELKPIIHQFIKRFKNFAHQIMLDPITIFYPYDIYKNGTILKFKVFNCFSSVNFEFSHNEIEELISAFQDIKKNELFNYKLFLKAYEEEDITSEESKATLTNNPISADINSIAIIACCQIREKLLARHRNIEMIFKDVNSRLIPSSDFQKRLLSIDVVLRATQIQALVRKYRVDMNDSIDWKAFCNDVNQSKTI